MATLVPVQEPKAFPSQFEALTGNLPYNWQESLFSLFLSGEVPPVVNLPTGSGKTSVMAVWLLALASQAARPGQPKSGVPRRLVWVVNRRVVVDQATEEAELIRKRIGDTTIGQLKGIRDAVRGLSLGRENQEVIGISTLRGEKEDNREWSKEPSRPAIIVGTVDMIGSRLLFSGYGNGRYWRPQDAGLLGQDVLVINDEAHLTPAFASLLASLERSQRATPNGAKPFWTIRLSATHVNPQSCWPHSLKEDLKHERFRQIFAANKGLNIHATSKQDSKLIELAMESTPVPARTLIFVREPEKVQEIATRLSEKVGADAAKRVLTLTGTMRGFERDQLVMHPVFQSFTKEAKRPKEPAWIIATSAGEVGVNISADRLISDMDTADHLLQRFGRLNRFGETEGIAHLLISPSDEKDSGKTDQKAVRKRATLAYLRKLPKLDGKTYDVSPAALFHTPPPAEACEEIPLQAVLHNWLIDVWSQTSVRGHTGRPPVEPWLHGKVEDYPETYLAWREDQRDLVSDSIIDDDRETVLEKYRVLAHERLREPTSRLQKTFAALLENEPSLREERVLCLKQDGSVSVMRLSDVADPKKRNEIEYSQLIVSPGCGSLRNGIFSPGVTSSESTAYDVSGCKAGDAPDKVLYDDQRACYRAVPAGEGGWLLERLGSVTQREPERLFRDLEPKTLRDFAKQRGWRLLHEVKPEAKEDENQTPFVLLYFRNTGSAMAAAFNVSLEDHHRAVAQQAHNLGTKLGVSKDAVQALELAGKLHDLGKGREIWQRAVGNGDVSNPVAKSVRPMRPRGLNGFRHELASLCDAEGMLGGSNISDEVRDLTLHLIAAHHGRARPCFETKAYDLRSCETRRASERLALKAAQRFGRLQDRYGAWGLAYLEAVFKAADQLASDGAEE